jgi:hypothetical protein
MDANWTVGSLSAAGARVPDETRSPAPRKRWTRPWGLGLALSALFLAGCATARPDFERHFHEGAASHDLWMSVLTTRYGCDTVAVIANMPRRESGVGLSSLTRAPQQSIRLGMPACTLASLVDPEVVAAWNGPEGVREEWRYREAHGPLTSVYLEGRQERALRVVPPVPKPAQ